MEHAENRPVLSHEDRARTRDKGAAKVRAEKIRIEQHSAAGMLWFAGWLFSIGFLHLSFWKSVLALLVWPYYIGVAVAASLAR
jgi:hypothetical protein